MNRIILNSVADQIEKKLIHGAVVLAGTPEQDLFTGVYGTANPEKGTPMKRDTIFDIASVTKPVGTNSALLLAVAEGKIDIDKPFTDYLTGFRTALKHPVSVRMLASHASGVCMDYPKITPPEKMKAALMDIPFPFAPYEQWQYTCTAFILLGLTVEAATGKTIDQLVSEKVFQPLGMTRTRWTKVPEGTLENTAKMINADPGIISDPGARAFAPYALGNAGLFSTADDLAKFCRMMLKNDGSIFPEKILSLAFTDCNPGHLNSPRSVGWDMRRSGVPGKLSDQTIHHSGWTGQSVWIDPENHFFLIVLTNRCGDWTKARDGRICIAEEVLSRINFDMLFPK